MSQGALTPTTPLSPPWGEGRPYHCGAPLGNFGPWGAELQTAMGGEGTQYPPALLSCSITALSCSTCVTSSPFSALFGDCSPPHLSPVPIGLRLTLCRGGGEHCGGRCRSIICCCSFSSALVTGSCVLERPRAWGRALWGRGVPIASALTAVGRGWEWGAGRGGFGVTAPLQRDTAAGILCMVLRGGGGDPKSGRLCPSVPHKRNILGVMP